MNREHPTTAAPSHFASRRAAAEDAVPDRAREIIALLHREPGDRLTCVRVFGEFYRCNWWAAGASPFDPAMIRGLEVSTYRVRKSCLVKATFDDGGKLLVEDATRVAADAR